LAPGPRMVRLLATDSPLARVMVPETPVASTVSPLLALASAARNEPAPVSAVLLTVITNANAGAGPVAATILLSFARATRSWLIDVATCDTTIIRNLAAALRVSDVTTVVVFISGGF